MGFIFVAEKISVSEIAVLIRVMMLLRVAMEECGNRELLYELIVQWDKVDNAGYWFKDR